jgi:hypothetical protein
MPTITITANGDYELKTAFKPNKTALFVSGALGAATATITYQNEALAYLPFTSGNVSVGQQYEVNHGANTRIFLTVTGADGSTALEVESVAA